jgi:threonine synthase
LIEALDQGVARVDGAGFSVTPFQEARRLAERLDLTGIELWVKDETGNVSGSHKARHLMGILIHLEVARAAGLIVGPKERLAIASCGNAALAAAVVARSSGWPLEVFIPPNASPPVVARLERLDARLHLCPRDDQPGDPCYRAFRAAIERGALPFCCQGPDNGLTIDGGMTLGYELAGQARGGPGRLDRVLVQVGGGALASACAQAMQDAAAMGVLPRMPRLCTVQTRGAYPLGRAYERLVERITRRVPGAPLGDSAVELADWIRSEVPVECRSEELRYAATHRDEFMWPWEEEPRSIAHGILDDEAYDWWAILGGMLDSGGYPVTVDEATIEEANAAANAATGIPVDHTGSAGLAGLMQLHRRGELRAGEVVAVLFTGRRREADPASAGQRQGAAAPSP